MLDVKLVRKRHASYPAIFRAINKNFLPKAGVEVQNEVVRIIRDKGIIDSGRLRSCDICRRVNNCSSAIART